MKTLTFQVPDEVYEACLQMARKYGRNVEDVVAEFLAKTAPKPRPKLTEEQRRAALAKLRRHFGAENLGHPTGADNESIDADLAREYGNTHEEKK